MNKLGWCAGIDKAELLHKLGFDYIECGLTALKLEDKEQHEKLLPLYKNSALPVSAFNLFLPGDLRVTGPDLDENRLRSYVGLAAQALAEIGAKISVLGSGRSRNVPEGWAREKAEEQLLQLFSWIADEFEGTGVTLAIEPLNLKESNIINSVSEGAHYVKLINRAPIRVLADFYHMDEDNEPLDTLLENRQWLAHIHLADTGRLAPGTGQYPYAQFTANLRAAGYTGLISAECKVQSMEEELPASLRFMKEQFQA